MAEAIHADSSKTKAARIQAESDQDKWIRMELVIVLLEATGRRLGSVRQLRWEDIDLTRGEIRWRADADKKGQEWGTPIPVALAEEIRVFQKKLGAVGGWVFPQRRNPNKAIGRDALAPLIREAEDHAKLPKLDGGLCHPYRRKWATERKHLSIKDVAAAGGWKDVGTLLTCYQQADRETMLAVMSEPRKVMDSTAMGS
jgi:integrase